MHNVLQDIQQVKSICQQLATSERHNAQMLAQQSGFANMAQTETHAAQQLQQCINLCNHMEQEIQQMSMQQQTQQVSSYGFAQNTYQPGTNPALRQAMQADKQYQENQWQSSQYQPQQYQQQQYQPQQYQSTGAQPYQSNNYGSYASQMNTQHMQPYASQQHAPGLMQVMQADRGAERSVSQASYGSTYRQQ